MAAVVSVAEWEEAEVSVEVSVTAGVSVCRRIDFFSNVTPAGELEMLKNDAENLKKELDAIGKRIVELEKAPSA